MLSGEDCRAPFVMLSIPASSIQTSALHDLLSALPRSLHAAASRGVISDELILREVQDYDQRPHPATTEQADADELFYSAYCHLGMQTWFQARSLNGFADWYDVQVNDERGHALRIYSCIQRVDGTPEFLKIPAPPTDFTGVGDILHRTLEDEQSATALIHELTSRAQEAQDYNTIQFLQWYTMEQYEEEEAVGGLIARFDIAQQSDAGILFMDSEKLT